MKVWKTEREGKDNVDWQGVKQCLHFEVPRVIKSKEREKEKQKKKVRKREVEEKENVDWHGVKVESTF